jgi:hypothetical protein
VRQVYDLTSRLQSCLGPRLNLSYQSQSIWASLTHSYFSLFFFFFFSCFVQFILYSFSLQLFLSFSRRLLHTSRQKENKSPECKPMAQMAVKFKERKLGPVPARIYRKLPWKVCRFFCWKRVEQIHSQGTDHNSTITSPRIKPSNSLSTFCIRPAVLYDQLELICKCTLWNFGIIAKGQSVRLTEIAHP